MIVLVMYYEIIVYEKRIVEIDFILNVFIISKYHVNRLIFWIWVGVLLCLYASIGTALIDCYYANNLVK